MLERKQSNKLYIMLKNILNLEGAQKLTKNEQILISGGIGKNCLIFAPSIDNPQYCGPGYTFVNVMPGRGNYCCKTV
jgi:hypothetical protein